VGFEKYLIIKKFTDYNAALFFDKIKNLLKNNKFDEAYDICSSGGERALPAIIGAGIKKAQTQPLLAVDVMGAETMHISVIIERRLNYLMTFGNVSTLLGLLGTVFGLIMSFAAVGKPDVVAAEKSSLLAAGISAAMNSTLVGLSISVPCILVYAMFRNKINAMMEELDRYISALLSILNIPKPSQQNKSFSARRNKEEEIADTDVTPMLNLMVMLIPFLLTSSEFIKIGTIELKLPESAAESSEGGEGGSQNTPQIVETNLQMVVIITSKGFNILHTLKASAPVNENSKDSLNKNVDVPLSNGKYNFELLHEELAKVKKTVLYHILKAYLPNVSEQYSLSQLYKTFTEKNIDLKGTKFFEDFENINIVAEQKIKYQTVVSVIDAARVKSTGEVNVPLFPNVSLGIGLQ
ncbi:MAG: MotA/TolQ/ExbB proton channel family protein, partial [Elusimicrobiota bacterium]